jgi:putative membrane protein
MENTVNSEAVEQKYKKWIILLSVVIPLAVALLFGVNLQKLGFDVRPLSFLPPIYAGINGLTAVVLFTAVWAIKNGKQKRHENLMKFAICLSVAFLAMYVAYHMTSVSAVFGDADHNGILSDAESEKVGYVRSLYIFILLTHIALSVIIIPFVLFTYVRALSKSFVRHKKLARITYPMWLYVAVTGVVVYFMISPYYAH